MCDIDIYLFGASNYGKKVYSELSQEYNICGFIDNDPKKWGGGIYEKPIISPNEFKTLNNNSYILITSDYAKDISIQLESMNISNFSIYPNLEFHSPRVSNIVDKVLCRKIDLAACKLFVKLNKIELNKIELNKLDISEYNFNYLCQKDWNAFFVYSCILYTLISENSNISTFLDYGGGTGLLSLLALEYGISNVYYNDIYDISCKDAYNIAIELGYKRQGYIEGDVDRVLEYSKENNILFDAVGSYDVIEHIFDLHEFYEKLIYILNKTNCVCMMTGANSYNTNFIEHASSVHLKCDFINRNRKFGHKERDSLRAYYEIRKDTIKKYLKLNGINLKEAEIIALAFLTNGLMIDKIERAVDNYINYDQLPKRDSFFEYNTCDPYTGNWAEHIINFNELKQYLENIGFKIYFSFKGNIETSSTIQLNSIYTCDK